MDFPVLKTKSEQRIEHLINIGRPLTDEESDELYRALHADYMRKWRLDQLRRKRARDPEICFAGNKKRMKRVLREAAR